MVANPMGPMNDDQGDPGDENDSKDIAECEQKITDLDARVTALEQKAGIGQSMPMPKKPGGSMPFFGGSYK